MRVATNDSAKRAGADDRVLEWESGPAAESLEEFKKNSIQSGILAKVRGDRYHSCRVGMWYAYV